MQVNRRSFLGAGAGGAAIALGVRTSSAAAPPSPAFHLGVASYSLRKFPRAEAIKMLQRLGEKYVNIKSFHLPLESTPDQIRDARKEFEDAGLVIVGGGNIAFPKADEADIRAKFEYAKLAGMPLIVCAPTKTTLPMMEKYVKEYDIRIAVHNHGPKDNFPSPLDALKILKDMDPRCGVCVDVGHTAQAGVDVLKAIRASGSRMLDMHIKDMRVYGDEATLCDVGDGVLPIPGIFRELEKMRYAAAVNLEYEINENDPLYGMARSFAYMRGVLAGIPA
ncbi:MAG TPA: sugar phosphate isomerase/epimerase [Bryobacteraceae bacterium]|nr:sugar phosphate isomerase/epimerase [Bryobacteraceae bacterium]